MKLGVEAATWITMHYKPPISIEFEGLYHPFLMMSKKRYAGRKWDNDHPNGKIAAAGIETVRRDYCELVNLCVQGSLDRLLNKFDRDGAVEFAKGMINDLLCNRVDLSLLVISKGISKKFVSEDDKDKKEGHSQDERPTEGNKVLKRNYAYGNIPHVRLAQRMAKRDLCSAPIAGERVAYVIVKGSKG